jgi:hypothetical protein
VISLHLSLLTSPTLSFPFLFTQSDLLVRPISRWIAMVCVDMPAIILASTLFSLIVLGMVNPHGDSSEFCLLVYFGSLIGFWLAILCSELSITPISAFLAFTAIAVLQISCSGFFIPRDSMAKGTEWVTSLSFLYWLIGQLLKNAYGGYRDEQGEKLLDFFEYQRIEKMEAHTYLTLYLVCLSLCSLFVLLFNASGAVIIGEITPMPERDKGVSDEVSEKPPSLNSSLLQITGVKSDETLPPKFGITALTTLKAPSRNSINSILRLTIPSFTSEYNATSGVGRDLTLSLAGYVERRVPIVLETTSLSQDIRAVVTFKNVSCSEYDSSSSATGFVLNGATGLMMHSQLCGVVDLQGKGTNFYDILYV